MQQNGENAFVAFAVTARKFEFVVFLNRHETILHMKTKIQRYVNVEPERQTLTHGDQELIDNRTVDSYGFNNFTGALIPIKITAAPVENENLYQPFTIMVFNYSLEVSQATTVAELKALITENLGIPAGSFEVSRLATKMEDHRTLYDYHVGPLAIITIERDIN